MIPPATGLEPAAVAAPVFPMLAGLLAAAPPFDGGDLGFAASIVGSKSGGNFVDDASPCGEMTIA